MKLLTKFEKMLFGGLAGGMLLGLALTFATSAKHAFDHAILTGLDYVQAHLVAELFAHPYYVGAAVPVLLIIHIFRMLRNQIKTAPKRRSN